MSDISTAEEANKFLHKAYAADGAECAVCRAATGGRGCSSPGAITELGVVFSVRAARVVQNEYTVRYRQAVYRILRQQAVRVRPKAHVLVEERLDGTRWLMSRGVELAVRASSGSCARRGRTQTVKG